VANPAYKGTFFKHDAVPASIERKVRKAEAAKDLADAYAEVDRRDGSICWVTGAFTGGVGDLAREHHHLKGRNVKPEWVTKPERIITVTRLAHRLITLGWIVVEGTDARKPIRFHWAAFVKPEQRVIRIKSRRWSQDSE
jgi:hypothetical protein